MNLGRREFLQVLAAAGAAGMALGRWAEADAAGAEAALYDLPPLGRGAGHVSLLHFTDCHAQLLPLHFREPSVNLGVGTMAGRFPHLVGRRFLEAASIEPGGALAHACTSVDFEAAARRYGKVGGFAHLATLVKRLKEVAEHDWEMSHRLDLSDEGLQKDLAKRKGLDPGKLVLDGEGPAGKHGKHGHDAGKGRSQ